MEVSHDFFFSFSGCNWGFRLLTRHLLTLRQEECPSLPLAQAPSMPPWQGRVPHWVRVEVLASRMVSTDNLMEDGLSRYCQVRIEISNPH